MSKHSEKAKEMAEAMKLNHFLNDVAVSVDGEIAFELLTLIDEKLSGVRKIFFNDGFTHKEYRNARTSLKVD